LKIRLRSITALFLLASLLPALVHAADPVKDPVKDTPSVNDAGLHEFSKAAEGKALPEGWSVLKLPKKPAPQFSITKLDDKMVLRVESHESAGTITHKLNQAAGQLSWTWRVDQQPASANLRERAGDDFAARVYVMFDVPLESLSFGDRTKIKLAKSLYGADIPTAALCYVWDNKATTGTSLWNPFTTRVRTIVLRGAGDPLSTWKSETVDLAKDFKLAFGIDAPRVTAIAIGNDTDQTHEHALAYFGDFAHKSIMK
jgi:hypothetical protein